MPSRRWTRGAACSVIAACSASLAHAQTPPRHSSAEQEGSERRQRALEVGIFGGLLIPSERNALYSKAPSSFQSPVPELGARVAFFPIDYLGLELEGAAGASRTQSDERAAFWAVRGQVIGQLPLGRFIPFLEIGAGRLGAGSAATGSDDDPSLHLGLGGKLQLDDFVGLRLDLRDHLTQKDGASAGKKTSHPEVLLGLTFALDTSSPPLPPPPDADADGVTDSGDQCPNAPGPTPTGCPPPVDSDLDGIEDSGDACPAEAGPPPTGCPERDSDHDCVPIPVDECPDQAGTTPNGCPDPDPDHDGIEGSADGCPREPETKNGFEDEDGCPDTLPPVVQKFSGVIPGIEFDNGKSTVRASSYAALDEAAAVLGSYPTLQIEISGHTDDSGDAANNLVLSADRAGTVKAYLVSRGVDPQRITTRGAGAAEPMASNQDAAGRQKNRRIEFKLISQ